MPCLFISIWCIYSWLGNRRLPFLKWPLQFFCPQKVQSLTAFIFNTNLALIIQVHEMHYKIVSLIALKPSEVLAIPAELHSIYLKNSMWNVRLLLFIFLNYVFSIIEILGIYCLNSTFLQNQLNRKQNTLRSYPFITIIMDSLLILSSRI